MTRSVLFWALLVAAAGIIVTAGAPDALAQSGSGPMMDEPGRYQGGWHHQGGGWMWGVHSLLVGLLMISAIAALVALTRYLWRLGSRVGGDGST